MAEQHKGRGVAGITKVEAVRRALNKLGNDCLRFRDSGFRKGTLRLRDDGGPRQDHQGRDPSSGCQGAEVCPSPGRGGKGSVPPPPVEASPAPAAGPRTPKAAEPITKFEAVRRAMEELGKDAPRARIQELAKEQFGLELTPKHVSDYRAKLVRRASKLKAKKSAERKAAREATQPTERPAVLAGPSTGNGKATVLMEDVLAVRELVARVGPEPPADS